jgi:heavy metal sensor kinase
VRFALWTAGLLLAAMVVFGVFVYVSMASSLAQAVDDSLQLSAAQALAAVNVENGQLAFGDAVPEVGDLPGTGTTVRILDPAGRVRQASGIYRDLPVDTTSLGNAQRGEAGFLTLSLPQSPGPIRVHTAPMVENGKLIAIIQVAQSLDPVNDTLHQLLAALLLSVPLLVLMAGAGGYWLAARALAPIDAITHTARRISAEDLHARLGLPPNDDEVGRLAATFDEMLDRLDGAFRRERQFTADASHELRTPLAAMQAILSVTRERRRSPEEYEQVLDDLGTQAGRLRGLVEDLLRLARTDVRRESAHGPVDLSTLVGDVAETMRQLAEDKGLALHVQVVPHLTVSGNYDDLIRLLFNLLDNAIKYTARGVITVSLAPADTMVELTVRDTGDGIAPEHLPHIFERFYRADTARTAGGNGLGLAIAQEIAQAHGGLVTVASVVGAGTTLTVRLPTMPDQP